MDSSLKGQFRRGLKILLSFVVFLVMLEAAARVDDRIRYGAPLLDKYSSDLLRTNDSDGIRMNVPGSHFEKWKINRFGFRGREIELQKPKGIKRIICMGSSETFGLYEDLGKEWPAQLGEMLASIGHFEVINASVTGLYLKDFRPYMEKYVLRFDPDFVILVVNPYYYGLENRGNHVAAKPNAGDTKKRDKGGRFSGWDLSQECRILPKMKQAVKRAMPEDFYRRYALWSMARQVDRLEHSYLKGRKAADVISKGGLENFKSDLENLVEFLRRKGIDVILISYPALISKENIREHLDVFLDYRRFCIGLSFEGIIDCLLKANEMIRSVAIESGSGFVDLESAIPKTTEFFGDNVHYTDKGAKIVALKLYEYTKGRTALNR